MEPACFDNGYRLIAVCEVNKGILVEDLPTRSDENPVGGCGRAAWACCQRRLASSGCENLGCGDYRRRRVWGLVRILAEEGLSRLCFCCSISSTKLRPGSQCWRIKALDQTKE